MAAYFYHLFRFQLILLTLCIFAHAQCIFPASLVILNLRILCLVFLFYTMLVFHDTLSPNLHISFREKSLKILL